jgi:hypothetical protein
MTRSELQSLVDRLPERVLDGRGAKLDLDFDDLHELTQTVIELTYKVDELTREWMARQRVEDGFPLHWDA